MPNKLLLDKTDPDIADALAGCKVGEPKTLELTVIPTRDDDTIFEADVSEVAYSPGDETTNTAPEAESETPATPPPKAGAAKGSATSY